jgi:3-hydroxyisobutyrate dehydrogenase-like beta-hydroxyacid dehydrogenase
MALYATDAFSGERVAEAFVLADKIGSEAEEIVAAMKAGSTETAIMAKQLADKYESY